MAKTILHKAETRGHADHGWLDTYHSFSFADYYNPERIHFGMLRVLNDDYIAPGMGFGLHPHDNMEILTIPLEGDLEHRDSMGNVHVIRHGEIQVMSAGEGIYHSEYNHSKEKPVKLLQIWIFPNERNVTPRYDQIVLNLDERKNKFQQILSPNPEDEGVWIYQDAWFHMGKFDQGISIEYPIKRKGNGAYLFIVSGEAEVEGNILSARDGLGIWETEKIFLKAIQPNTEILVMDIPMT